MALTQQDKEELYQYIISRGRGIASLPDGDSDLSNKYLGPVIEYTSGGTAGRLVRLAVSLLQGKGATMRRNGDEVQWKLQGSTDVWETLFTVSSLKGDKGENGKSPVFRKGETALEYKLEGEEDTTYKTLFTFAEVMPDVSDFSEEGITLLQQPATEAATEVRQTMSTIQSEADAAIQSATEAAEAAQTAAGNVQDGKTPVITIGTVEDGSSAAATMTSAGTDESGNPKSALNLVLPKGNTGPAPILELGEVTTVEPSDPASATFQPNGVDPSGANKYRLALSIPKGKSGQDGTGAGNVLVNNEASLLASKQYAFKPGQDGSVNGAFVEVEAAGGAIEIPAGIMDLDTSATSEQILAVWPMEDILKVIKGKPGGVYYIHVDGATVYVQVIATVSEDPTVTPHDVTLSIPVITPGEGCMQVMNLAIETDESTVSITGVVYDSIGIPVNDNGSGHYSGVLIPIKDKETGVVVFSPWFMATFYQYVILDIDDFKTDASAQIKEKLKRSPIIAERVDAGDTEFSALRNTLYAYGSVFGMTRSGSLMFMDSSIVGESSVAMYFKGGDTLYTVTISEDPTTKDLSATVVESSIGQSNHTLDLSPLFDSDGNPVSAVTDEFIAELQKAYEERYSNCTAKFFNDAIIPLTIQKITDGFNIMLSSVSDNELGLDFASYDFVIDTTLKTFTFAQKSAQLETSGDGSKFLSNDGTYKTVSGGESGVYRLPEAIMSLDENSTSDEIFTAWGGREVLLDFAKNYDVSKAYIVSISEGRTTYNVQIHYEYADDTNFVVVAFFYFNGENLALVTTVMNGLASVSSSGTRTPMLTSTSNDIYFKYSTNDGELMWNNLNADTDTGGTGPRYAAYSRHKNVKIEDNGDGTQFLSNDGTYKAISSGAGNIYHLDLDISGYISDLTPEQQTTIFGKTYIAPTNDNIIELLGGTEGIRELYNKLAPSNNIVVTAPFMAYIVPTQLVSSYTRVLTYSNNEYWTPLTDGGSVGFGFGFLFTAGGKINVIEVSITIENFNTSTQSGTYLYSEKEQNVEVLDTLSATNTTAALSANQGRILDERIDKKVGSEEITTIKKLTQAAYDALSSKDSKTLYIIVG